MNNQPLFLLNHAIDNAASMTPQKEAVRFGSSALSYEELVIKANTLANHLVRHGVGRNDRVGIFMNKGLESIIAVYGIMKAGAAYVPLDPHAPVNRIQYVVDDCGIRCLVTNEMKAGEVRQMLSNGARIEVVIGLQDAGSDVHTISWNDIFEKLAPSPPQVSLTEQDLSYILYTSGSTGVPKGIMHSHRSALTFASWAAITYDLQADDVLSNHAPFHFDLSTFDFFASALVGATTVIIPEALTKFPANLAKLIEKERISVWYSVPYALIQILLRGGIDKHDFSSLRWVLFAGEPFPTKHLRDLMNKIPHAHFSNLYGPTETNVCTYYHVPPLPEASDEPIPIGVPCANVEDLVLDDDDRPVATGEVGELLIRSPLVMRGYWGRQDLSQRGFYHRTVFDEYEDIFYRTGDLVQQLSDGNYKYLGRKDRQIKTRGYRVELDEIEVALLSYDGVEEAAVFPVPDGEGSNLIEAAVVPRSGIALESPALIDHISNQLPPYAIPANITITDKFPRTSTGKIDRRQLQSLALADSS